VSDAEHLEIKKRARRRLVGAIALALLAAIVLPVMMEQEPRPTTADIQITIPDRNAGAEPSRPATALPDGTSFPTVVPGPEEQMPGAVAEPAPAPAELVPPTAATPAPDAEPPSKTARPEAGKAEAARAESAAAEAARARAILEGKEVPRGDSFVLQIGAFSDADKAERLAAELKKQGFAAYTEPAGKVVRVRVGPVAGRSAADKAAVQLKALGFSTVITAR
jgi:DedD protein